MSVLTMNKRPQPYRTPGEWLVFSMFLAIGFLLGSVMRLVITVVTFPVHTFKAWKDGSQASDVEPAVTATPAAAASEPVSAALPEIDWDSVEIEPAEIKRIDLKKGYVTCWFYREQGMAKGKLTVTTKSLQKVLGKVVPLPQLDCRTINDAVAAMQSRAEGILATGAAEAAPAAKRLVKDRSRSEPVVETCQASGDDVAPPLEAYAMTEPITSEKEPYEPYEAPVEAPAKKVPTPRVKVPPKQVQMSYRGLVLGFGFEDRKFGERVSKHYGVRLFDDDLQAENPIWGNDLQRVIEESGVKVGDRVRIDYIGETTVPVRGKPKKKKLWALNKV